MNVGFNSHPSLTDMEPLWPKNNHPILRKIDLLIRSNVSNELFDANNLSKQVGISVSSLNRFLKSEVNASAGTLIKNFRLEVAYQMITETDIPIKSIGISIGFVQPSNFTRAFIRKYKKRPSQLRLESTQKKKLESIGLPHYQKKKGSIFYGFSQRTLEFLMVFTLFAVK